VYVGVGENACVGGGGDRRGGGGGGDGDGDGRASTAADT